jgi:hypothetical protein
MGVKGDMNLGVHLQHGDAMQRKGPTRDSLHILQRQFQWTPQREMIPGER